MTENKLEKFVEFLYGHLVFTVGIRVHIDNPDWESFSPEQMSEFPRKYERTLGCGNNAHELNNFRNEALQYLHDLHLGYSSIFTLQIDHAIEMAKKFREGFYRMEIGNHSFLTHKDLDIQFDPTYEKHHAFLEGDSYRSLRLDDYLLIEEHLAGQLKAVDAILNYCQTLSGELPMVSGNEKTGPSPGLATERKKSKKSDEGGNFIPENKEKEIYTIKDLAALLQVSTRTIYNWKDQGLLSFSQVGSKTFVSSAQLDEFIRRNEVKSLRMRRGL